MVYVILVGSRNPLQKRLTVSIPLIYGRLHSSLTLHYRACQGWTQIIKSVLGVSWSFWRVTTSSEDFDVNELWKWDVSKHDNDDLERHYGVLR